MKRLLYTLLILIFASTAFAANPRTHDGSGTGEFVLDWSAMVTEDNPASARYRLTEGEGTPGSWTTWASPWADAVIALPETEEDIAIEVEVTDLAGRTGSDSFVVARGDAYCSSGSAIVSVTDTQGGFDWSNTSTIGQSFTVPSSGSIYSISISIPVYTSSGEVKLRVGSSSDMSSSYLAESTITISSTGVKEFVFSSPPTLNTGTTYYFAFYWTGTAGNFQVDYDQTNEYANGQRYYSWTGTHNLTDALAGHDLYFIIKQCD
jgi:hypothetical protein